MLSVLLTGGSWHLVARGVAGGGVAIGNCIIEGAIALGLVLLGVILRTSKIAIAGLHRSSARQLLLTWHSHHRLIIGAAVVGAAGNMLTYQVVRSEGAGVAALLANFVPAWMLIAGLSRGESLRLREIGLLVALVVGAVIFSWHGQLPSVVPICVMLLACAGTAAKQLAMAHLARRERLVSSLICLCVLMSCVSGLCAAVFGDALPDVTGLVCLVGAAWLGGCMGMVLLFLGFARMGVARVAPFDTLRGLVALAIGVALGASSPAWNQYLGAMIMAMAAVGVVLARSLSEIGRRVITSSR